MDTKLKAMVFGGIGLRARDVRFVDDVPDSLKAISPCGHDPDRNAILYRSKDRYVTDITVLAASPEAGDILDLAHGEHWSPALVLPTSDLGWALNGDGKALADRMITGMVAHGSLDRLKRLLDVEDFLETAADLHDSIRCSAPIHVIEQERQSVDAIVSALSPDGEELEYEHQDDLVA